MRLIREKITSNRSFLIDSSTNGVNDKIIAGDRFQKHNNSGIIHEHDFELLTLGSLVSDSYLKCKTCNIYFCYSSGRVVSNRLEDYTNLVATKAND